MSAAIATATFPKPTFASALHAEWIKLTSVRSTWWTIISIVSLGVGLTVLICGLNAEWLASEEANEAVGSFITWGMMVAQIGAVVLGCLIATAEYGTGQITSTFAATPKRGQVIAAKAVLLTVLLFVVGTVTALAGYFGGNWFLEREGIGLALEGDVLRAMYGSGLYLAGLGLMSLGFGFIVRHSAGAISTALALIFVVSNMVFLVPGEFGEWIAKLMPSNAGSVITTPVSFNPNLLDAWPGFAVFLAETLVVLALAWVLVRRRDA